MYKKMDEKRQRERISDDMLFPHQVEEQDQLLAAYNKKGRKAQLLSSYPGMGKTNTVARFLISKLAGGRGKREVIICPNTMVTTRACGLSQAGIPNE